MTYKYPVSFVETSETYTREEGYIPVQVAKLTWDEITHHVLSTRAHTSKDGPAIIPSWIGETIHPKSNQRGRWRHKRAVRCVSLLCLDVEGIDIGGDDPYTCAEWLTHALPGVQAVLYTSWNHGVPLSPSGEVKWQPGHPRFRAILPLKKAICPASYALLAQWALHRMPGIDSCVKDAARLYYTTRADNPHAVLPSWHMEIPGHPLDPHALPTDDLTCDLLSVRDLHDREQKEKRARDEAAQERRDALTRGDLVLDASRQRTYALAALRGSCEDIHDASPGDRHATITRVAWRMGGMVLEGVLSWDETRDRLHDAACAVLPRDRHEDALRTITGQMNEGAARCPFDWTRVASVSSTYDYLANTDDGPVTFKEGGVQ